VPVPQPCYIGGVTESLAIRTMTETDLAAVLGWAREEGWNPGLDDAAAFHVADPEGFLLGEVGGAPAAAISAVRHDHATGFIGLYIVRPPFRGLGHGLGLWRAGMARLDGCAVGLDGVLAQQANYSRWGFALAHRNVRWGGRLLARPAPEGIVPLGDVASDLLLAYDAGVTGYPRPSFLRAWSAPAGGRLGLALVGPGGLHGYGVVRECCEGAKIGPLFAEDAAAAAGLLAALAAATPARPLFLDAPEPNAAAASLARDHGLAPVFETARMWRGPAPAEDLARTFGVATFELG
jgi:hypothetical protein